MQVIHRLLASVLAMVAIPLAAAQSKTTFVGRLPCADAIAVLNQGTFSLPLGQVRLKDGRACTKAAEASAGCEWTVTLVRSELWGDKSQYLVAVVEAVHDSPGAWLSVLVYRCQGDRYEQVFAESYGPRGAKLVLGAGSTFDVFVGEWRREDPGCCPSRERQNRYGWNDSKKQFVLLESRVTARKRPA